ncbi:MAG: MFS transporter [Paracoccaceae bacterium]|nr:MFS transporter [Paracoccaceae bacterium]
MLKVFRNLTYRRLFMAQIVALIGTGLATVALGLLAYDLAGQAAGQVLGTALAIKMIAYVTLAPVAAALTERLPRRGLLISLDLLRAGVVLCLPFVSEIWQVYALIFVLQAASAAFTPAFQALIPEVLPDEADYTRALSLSRLAYDLESLASPMLAAVLLLVMGFSTLFVGTAIGFAGSALLVFSVTLPARQPGPSRPIWARMTRGLRLYLATPRLRGVLALTLTVAAAGAMVIVNTVVMVKAGFGLAEPQVALALALFGGGSMVAALLLPRLLDRADDRKVMLAGAVLLVAGLVLGPLVPGFGGLVGLWAVLGFGYSVVQTPVGRLLRRSAAEPDRPALFAAQFALSHGCWLLTYPLAGWLGSGPGMAAAFAVLAALGGFGLLAALWLWLPEVAHDHHHDDLPADHPHLADRPLDTAGRHRHLPLVDRWHPPRAGTV